MTVAARPDRTTPPAHPDRATPRARAVLAQARMETVLLVRSPESLLVTLGVPVGLLVFFSVIDVLPSGGQRAVDFLVPGVLAISVAATGLVAVGIQTAFERKYGVLKLLGGTPLSRPSFLVAKALAVGVMVSVQAGLVVLISLAWLDWRPSGGALLLPVGVLLGAATFTALGLLLAGALRAEATLALTNALFLLLLLVSGVAFDADALPEAVAIVGRVLPLGALGDLLRAATQDEGPAFGPLSLVVGWGVAATLLAARTFRWEP